MICVFFLRRFLNEIEQRCAYFGKCVDRSAIFSNFVRSFFQIFILKLRGSSNAKILVDILINVERDDNIAYTALER